jgi:O-methyltransferase
MSTSTVSLSPELRSYLLTVGVREDRLLAELRAETARLPEGRMQISPEQGALMGVLARLMGASQILEVGTFTGYSSMVLARTLPPGGRITCCDRSPEWTAIAKRYWAAAGLTDRVELRIGDATDTLSSLARERPGTYDLVFIDADKENLLRYHELALTLARPGGALLYDNVLWSGRVADPTDQHESTVAVRALNSALATDQRIEIAMIPVGDGLTVAWKRPRLDERTIP